MITTRILHGSHRAVWVAVLLYTAGGVFSNAHAQVNTNITLDGTLGTRVTPAGNVFNIDGGTIRGGNQFHSFGQFNVGTGNTANFSVANTIQNIISRVTGGVRSQIDGTINSTISGTSAISGANLFLLNPAGIMFGRNARLNIGGSFHATTADYIKLGTDGIFYADLAKGSMLTSAPPSAFGFLTSNPAGIDVQTGVFDPFVVGGPLTNRLQVLVGKTLSLVGGPINVGAPSGQSAAGFVFAPGGVVNIASVASPGEATFTGGINVDAFTKLGEIRITGGAIVDGREINIRGGRLEITDATLFPGVSYLGFFLPGAPPPNGGQVSIHVTDDVTITGTRLTLPTRLAAGIQTSNDLLVPGDVPGVNIEAGRFSMSGLASIETNRSGPGNPATVVITADTIDMRNGASIVMRNRASPPTGGGTLTINGNNMTLSSDGRSTGIDIGNSFDFGDSASVTIKLTGNLTLRGNTFISTNSFSSARDAGEINVNAANILLAGPGRISAEGRSKSSNVTLLADGKIVVENGFQISANTFGAGGNIDLNSGGRVQISNGGQITTDSRGGTGRAGNVQITAGDQIVMTDGSVSTRAVTSDGGNITLNAPKFIRLTDSQITTSVEGGFGSGGNINIDPQFLILNNSRFLANAFGGPGGNINIRADVFLVNSGGQFPTSLAGIVDASSALSTPGTVNIQAAITNVSGLLQPLPENIFQATALLHQSCAARFSGGKLSSLAVGSRDGLPLEPGGFMPSPLYRLAEKSNPSITQAGPGAESFQLTLASAKPKFSLNWPCVK